MKKKKIAQSLSLLMIVSLSFTACQDDKKNEKTEVSELQEKFNKNMKETIAIHDELMPKIIEINQLLTDLEIQSTKMDRDEYNRASAELQEAHGEMMSWMKEFSNYFDKDEVNSGITTEDIDELKAKNEQLDRIKKLAKQMQNNINRSLKNGHALYERYR